MKYKKAIGIILIAIIVLAIALIASLLIYFGGTSNKTYTWEEFEALSQEEQVEFQNSFKSQKGFEKWMVKAQKNISLPWKEGGKKPSEYTWEEFEALTATQQIKFQDSFKNFKDFEKWMKEAQIVKVDVPWENGGKKPSEYTWEEFEALTAEQQMVFQNSFKNFKDFEKWMESVTVSEEEIEVSFNKNDLFSVTWEEFEAMTGEEQMIFQNSFGGFEEFDKWLQANEPK